MDPLVAPGCRSGPLISTYSLSPGSLLPRPAVSSIPLVSTDPLLIISLETYEGICEAFISLPSHILSGSILVLFLEDIFSFL